MLTQVSVDKRQQIMRFGVIGVACHGLLQCNQRQLGQPAVVQHLPPMKPGHRIIWFLITGPGQPITRCIQPAARFL
jgi:hypothetical protein